MSNHGKRYNELLKLVDSKKVYSPEEAIDLAKKTSNVKFDASIELHIKLGIDTKRGEEQVRGMITLPNSLGQKKIIAVFAEGDKAEEAKKAGANIVGGKELIDEIKKSGAAHFDIALATPDMMKNLGQIAKILGPKGLMPSPKNETVTENIAKTMGELQKGKVAFKNDDGGNIHQIIGKVSYDNQKLLENFNVFTEAIKKAKPVTVKAIYIVNTTLSSTMGPGIKVKI
jgi:large subunit ribosomal protein L1